MMMIKLIIINIRHIKRQKQILKARVSTLVLVIFSNFRKTKARKIIDERARGDEHL